MCTISMASDVAFGASSCILPTKRKHIAAVTTPIGTDVGNGLKSVGDAVIYLIFVILLFETNLSE